MNHEIFQNGFRLWFPLVMISFPLVIAMLIRRKPHATLSPETQAQAIRKWFLYLLLGTLAALLLHLAIWQWWAGPEGNHTWVLFFPLWFGLAQRVLAAKDSGWDVRATVSVQDTAVPDPVRGADLSRRDRESAVPSAAWISAWLAWAGMLAVSALLLEMRFYWMLLFPLSGGMAWLILGRWAARYSATEPEPRDPSNSPELAEAYARFRRQKQWAWYFCGVSAMFVFSLPTLVVATRGPDALQMAIWIGASGGALLGTLGGGGIGTWGSLQRAKLQRMYQEACRLEQPHASS